jgi:hypothetical protein
MEKLDFPREALICLNRCRVCVVELHHEEFTLGETYTVQVTPNEIWIVKVIGVQDVPLGRDAHKRFAIFAPVKRS